MSEAISSGSGPLVSIGLPVYNGSNYVRQAMESVLAQTYRNIELIVSDNASTDDTWQICQEIGSRDGRVRLFANEKNVGAAVNYNRVFELARGKYFKWAAHDDILAPPFIERAVEVLEADPGVSLCCTKTGMLTDAGEVAGTYEPVPAWDSSSPSERFRSLVHTPHACVAVFGVARTAELARTPLIAPYVNSDRILMAELGLHGRFFEIPEFLFFRRDHPGCSVRSYPDPRQRIVWFDPNRSANFSFPEWYEVFGYAGAVARSPVSIGERLKCWLTVGGLSLSRWRPLLADFKYAAYGVVNKALRT